MPMYFPSKEVEVRECVIAQIAYRGDGTPNQPGRMVTQVWTRDGELIAEHDPCANSGSKP